MKVRATFCKHCGQSLGPEDRFCVRCGQLAPHEHFESDAVLVEPSSGEASGLEQRQRGQETPKIFDLNAPAHSNAPKQLYELPASPAQAPAARTAAPQYRRRRRFPIVELIVAILLAVGAVMAFSILRSTLATKPPSIAVTISPDTARIAAGKSSEFAAAVSSTADVEVNWTIQEGSDGGRVAARGAKAQAGRVWSLVAYTAPRYPGTYHLVAASKADPSKFAAATITVVRK